MRGGATWPLRVTCAGDLAAQHNGEGLLQAGDDLILSSASTRRAPCILPHALGC